MFLQIGLIPFHSLCKKNSSNSVGIFYIFIFFFGLRSGQLSAASSQMSQCFSFHHPQSSEENYKKSDKSSLEKVNHWIVRVYDWDSLSALLGFRLFKYWNSARAIGKSVENPGKVWQKYDCAHWTPRFGWFAWIGWNGWSGESVKFYGTCEEIAGITWIILESYAYASLFVCAVPNWNICGEKPISRSLTELIEWKFNHKFCFCNFTKQFGRNTEPDIIQTVLMPFFLSSSASFHAFVKFTKFMLYMNFHLLE